LKSFAEEIVKAEVRYRRKPGGGKEGRGEEAERGEQEEVKRT